MCAAESPTEIDLKAIEYRYRAATSGPWESFVVGRDMEAGLNCIATGSAQFLEIVGGTIADQDFIAHAREDIPQLIAEIRRLCATLNAVTSPLAPVLSGIEEANGVTEGVATLLDSDRLRNAGAFVQLARG